MCDTEIIEKHRYQSIVINYPIWDYTISIHFFSYLVVYLVYNHLKIFTRYIASSGIKIDFFFFNIEHSRKFDIFYSARVAIVKVAQLGNFCKRRNRIVSRDTYFCVI